MKFFKKNNIAKASNKTIRSASSSSLGNETNELIKRVRQIEIKTKGLTNHIFAGDYHSAFKGRGMSFSEVREYHYGDDVRAIDWNVTARFKAPFIKVYEEERELTVLLLVDISNSNLFGTTKQIKRDLITEICAVISFSALTNNDKVGVLFFSDTIEKYIPPKKGKSHVLYIIRELLSIKPKQNAKTSIEQCLKFFNNTHKKKSIAFILSDFYSSPYKQALNIACKKHDIIGIHVYDKHDKEMPNIGLINVKDLESNTEKWLDTANHFTRKQIAESFAKHELEQKNTFLKSGAEIMHISTNQDFVNELQKFFKRRK